MSLPIRHPLASAIALLLLVPLGMGLHGPAAPATGDLPMSTASEAPQAILDVLEKMRAAIGKLKDATYTLHRHEWKAGKWLPAQEMAVKYRPPNDLYLRWTGSVTNGREVLYRGPTWNNGRLRVNAGRFVPTVDVDPLGSLALGSARQPVWMAGIGGIVNRILLENDKLVASPTLNATYRDQGEVHVRGIPSRCYEADLPRDQDPSLYARKVLVCISQQTWLPSRFKSWDVEDGAFRLLEEYDYTDLRVNPGLTDLDFDPTNPAYGF